MIILILSQFHKFVFRVSSFKDIPPTFNSKIFMCVYDDHDGKGKMEKITICSEINGVYTLFKSDSWGQEELLYFSHIVPKHGIYYSYKQN